MNNSSLGSTALSSNNKWCEHFIGRTSVVILGALTTALAFDGGDVLVIVAVVVVVVVAFVLVIMMLCTL